MLSSLLYSNTFKYSTYLLVILLTVLLTITHTWYSVSSVGITDTLSTAALLSLTAVNLVVSKLLIVKYPVLPCTVSVIVTIALATVAVKSSWASIAVFKFVAVASLLVSVLNSAVPAVPVVDVKVTVVPSDFVKVNLVPVVMFA